MRPPGVDGARPCGRGSDVRVEARVEAPRRRAQRRYVQRAAEHGPASRHKRSTPQHFHDVIRCELPDTCRPQTHTHRKKKKKKKKKLRRTLVRTGKMETQSTTCMKDHSLARIVGY
eukprot:2158660-Prymnesium_polylepis.2